MSSNPSSDSEFDLSVQIELDSWQEELNLAQVQIKVSISQFLKKYDFLLILIETRKDHCRR